MNILMMSQLKIKRKLVNSKDDALMSKDLATINVESPIDVNLNDTKLENQDDNTNKIELFKSLNLNNYWQILMKKLITM